MQLPAIHFTFKQGQLLPGLHFVFDAQTTFPYQLATGQPVGGPDFSWLFYPQHGANSHLRYGGG
jgi:hypothetical protein